LDYLGTLLVVEFSMGDKHEEQQEEVETLEAIYMDDFVGLL